MTFEPIAVTGMGCLLPGAEDPDALWQAILDGRDLLSEPPPAYAGIARRLEQAGDARPGLSERGGYIAPSPKLERVLAASPALAGLDPVFAWMLYAARAALADAGHPEGGRGDLRAGAIFGNLSFPTRALTRWAEWTWLSDQDPDSLRALGLEDWPERIGPEPDPRNRFLGGLPPRLLADALALDAGAYAVDAACASSLYAVRRACERLTRGEADLMLAGGINGTDPLCLHTGFGHLGAQSPSGQSRPFHRDADGLVASEGAAFVVLRRLADAVRAGERILGVIRGVGLSNDGGARGRLTPDSAGQVRAMTEAYAMAAVDPADITFVECHATGTPVGDRTEAISLAAVVGGRPEALAIGSLKSNLGHLVTAAGAAGMIKVLLAMRHRTLPPGRHADAPIEALRAGGLRLLGRPEPWTAPRLFAAVSAFGFGGANAHLVLEEWRPEDHVPSVRSGRPRPSAVAPARPSPVAIVGVGLIAADQETTLASVEALVRGPSRLRTGVDGLVGGAADAISVDVRALRLPPSDVARVAPRDLALFQAAREALADAAPTDPGQMAVIVATEAQTAVSGQLARIHAFDWLSALPPTDRSAAARAFAPPADAATIAGVLPNMAANLLNGAFGIRGGSYTLSAGRMSGLLALSEGVAALRRGDVESVLVGAADLSAERVHAAAAARLWGDDRPPGDAAVALVLRPLAAALARGERVYAVLGDEPEDGEAAPLEVGDGPLAWRPTAHVGCAYAAEALVYVAAAAVALGQGLYPDGAGASARGPATDDGRRWARVTVEDEAATRHHLWLSAEGATARRPAPAPHLVGADTAASISVRAHVAVRLPRPAVAASRTAASADAEAAALERMAPAPALGAWPASRSPAAGPRPDAGRAGAPAAVAAPAVARLPAAAPANPLVAAHLGYLERARDGHLAYLASIVPYAEAVHAAARRGRRGPCAAWTAPTAAVGAPGAGAGAPPLALPRPLPAVPPAPGRDGGRSGPEGPVFDRAALERHALGRASDVFGPEFRAIDAYRRVRMPGPPLLLVDRVTGLRAEARSMGLGTVWTESRVDADAWYMHDGAMLAGAMVEAGQADLFLISYLGIDFLTQGERVYRLLGCDLTFHEGPARPGDRLSYEIHVDGHSAQGGVRLFFFHYDAHTNGRLSMTVRNGQAGFFTDEELRQSRGGLWSPAEMRPQPGERVDPPRVEPVRASLGPEEVLAFARGDLAAGFGPAFRLAASHVRTPRLPLPPLLLIDRVTTIAVAGGPLGRGYLRAESDIRGDEWFFQGHFHDDPAMPGTLMFESCLQAMSIYLAALGFSLDKDGWRFAPATGRPYRMACRGQVTPAPHKLVYEVFVRSVVAGPRPSVTADVVAEVDGLQAFHCRDLCLELRPDWPITSALGLSPVDLTAVDPMVLHAAWGQPSAVFGEAYRPFDDERRTPRLPGPPYLFISRFTAFSGPRGGMAVGSALEAEFDVSPDAWYFPEGEAATMPLAALVEVALQPCGALSAYVGVPLRTAEDVHVRNLDGDLRLLASVPRARGRLVTRATLQSLSTMGSTTIEAFHVTVALDGVPVAEVDSVFGHFTDEALGQQAGFGREGAPASADGSGPGPVGEALQAGSTPLSMLERLVEWAPAGGAHGLGRLVGEMDVDPGAWFFRAHFYQDPVQPGSLGLEAMAELVRESIVRRHGPGRGPGVAWQSLAPEGLSWQYRGQVVGTNRRVVVAVEISASGVDERGPYAYGDGTLWVDGLCIYRARRVGVRRVDRGAAADAVTLCPGWLGAADATGGWRLDPDRQPWLSDHRPTFARPVLPLAAMADILAQAARAEAGAGEVVALRNVRAERWLVVDRPLRLTAAVTGDGAAASGWYRVEARAAEDGPVSGQAAPMCFAAGEVRVAERWSEALVAAPPPLEAARPAPDPYATGVLFHGPSLQVIERLAVGENGVTAHLSAAAADAVPALLPLVVLDGIAQCVGGDLPSVGMSDWAPGLMAFPVGLPEVRLYARVPTRGSLRCEVRRLTGERPAVGALVRFTAHLYDADVLLAWMRMDTRLLPAGPPGALAPADRRAFLTGARFVPGGRIATVGDGEADAAHLEIARLNWLPGTLEALYGTDRVGPALTREIVGKDLVGQLAEVPPAAVSLPATGTGEARTRHQPLNVYPLAVTDRPGGARARLIGPGYLDLAPLADRAARRTGVEGFLMTDVWCALVAHTVRRLVLAQPEAFTRAAGAPLLFLANHQTGLESVAFSLLASALTDRDVAAVAKAEHRHSWIGRLQAHAAAYPGVCLPEAMLFVDRSRPDDILAVHKDAAALFARGGSLLVHVEGTRALSARHRMGAVSGTWLDLAIAEGVAVVPVRFVGGLPVEPAPERQEFGWRFARQDIFLGPPLTPEAMRALDYRERTRTLVEAIEALGPPPETEAPGAPEPALERAVEAAVRTTGLDRPLAALAVFLRRWPTPGREAAYLIGLDPSAPVGLYGDARDGWLEASRPFVLRGARRRREEGR